MIKCIIIEDESDSRILLQEILINYLPEVQLIGVADNVEEAVMLIDKLQPQLLLMDIEINGGNSFDILNQTKFKDFSVIFITGYDHYALNAIKYSAIDYILKPVSIKDLQLAISKIKRTNIQTLPLTVLETQLKSSQTLDQIVVKSNTSYHVLNLKDILYFHSYGQYVFIHHTQGSKILANNSIGFYENLLKDSGFFRCHKSYLINMIKVKRLITKDNLLIELDNNIQIELAVRRKSDFITILNQFQNN